MGVSSLRRVTHSEIADHDLKLFPKSSHIDSPGGRAPRKIENLRNRHTRLKRPSVRNHRPDERRESAKISFNLRKRLQNVLFSWFLAKFPKNSYTGGKDSAKKWKNKSSWSIHFRAHMENRTKLSLSIRFSPAPKAIFGVSSFSESHLRNVCDVYAGFHYYPRTRLLRVRQKRRRITRRRPRKTKQMRKTTKSQNCSTEKSCTMCPTHSQGGKKCSSDQPVVKR